MSPATALAVTLALAVAAAPGAAQGAEPSAVLHRIADSTFFPEGVARDEARGRWLVSSVRHGTIVAVHDDGRVLPFTSAADRDAGALLGLVADPVRGVLFAGSAAVPQAAGFAAEDTLRAAVLEFDLATGRLRRRIALPDAGRHRIPGDLALGPDGTLYVSDGLAARLYAIPASGPARVLRSPLFASPQGIAPTPSGDALLVSDYRNGLLLVPVDDPAGAVVVADSGGRRLQGVDGLAWDGDALVAVHNGRLPGRVLRVELSADRRGIIRTTVLETVPGAGEPTHGVVRDGAFVFVANSPWSAYDERGLRKSGTMLAPPELRRLPLPR